MVQGSVLIPIDPIVLTLIILLVANIVVFLLYGIDKRKARKNALRIPESSLLLAALIGPFGALSGMLFFHHKTRKLRFLVCVPLLMAFQILAAILFLGK